MERTPIEHSKPTRTQRFKSWLIGYKKDFKMLCVLILLAAIAIYLTSSQIVAFLVCIPIGVVIGLILVDMIYD